MMEPKTEIIIVGHILEKNIIFQVYEKIKDIDVDVRHCEISFTTLKEGIEEKKPSTMRCYLVGPAEERKKAVEEIKKIAEKYGYAVHAVDYEEMWKK